MTKNEVMHFFMASLSGTAQETYMKRKMLWTWSWEMLDLDYHSARIRDAEKNRKDPSREFRDIVLEENGEGQKDG